MLQKPNKLNLGCGKGKLDGFINVDIQADLAPDLILDIRYLDGIQDNSIEEINADHVIEHFQHWLTYSILMLWFQKLQLGGTLKMTCPDLQTICRDIADGKHVNERILDIYGAENHPWNYHCNGFTPETMNVILTSIGFKNIEVSQVMVNQYPNLFVKAIK